MKRLPNIQRHLEAEYRVLNVLASERSPIGFNELQGKASVSSRTLAEHLKNLIPTIVQKIRGKYCITDAGRQCMENIEQHLETWAKKVGDRQFHVEIVEVHSIGPKHFCKGTLKVTSPRRLLLGERGNLDKAVTHNPNIQFNCSSRLQELENLDIFAYQLKTIVQEQPHKKPTGTSRHEASYPAPQYQQHPLNFGDSNTRVTT